MLALIKWGFYGKVVVKSFVQTAPSPTRITMKRSTHHSARNREPLAGHVLMFHAWSLAARATSNPGVVSATTA
jgi:hypothetical protein